MSELEHLRVRDDVLQAMYWMRSEGISGRPSGADLSRFLAMPEAALGSHLTRLVDEGRLALEDGCYSLTELGEDEGKRTFAEEFADLTKPTHGDCDEDCWCHESPDEAARCLDERVHHHA